MLVIVTCLTFVSYLGSWLSVLVLQQRYAVHKSQEASPASTKTELSQKSEPELLL